MYATNLPSDLPLVNLPNLVALVQGTRLQNTGQYTWTSGQTTFTSFAKSASWGADLYEDLVNACFDVALVLGVCATCRRPLPDLCSSDPLILLRLFTHPAAVSLTFRCIAAESHLHILLTSQVMPALAVPAGFAWETWRRSP